MCAKLYARCWEYEEELNVFFYFRVDDIVSKKNKNVKSKQM